MKSRTLLILLSLLILFSCEEENLTESILSELPPFNEIELNSPFDVYLKEDTSFFIEIYGNENIIEDIDFKVENNILKIINVSNSKWLTPTKNKIEIYISSKQLSKVSANETCNILTLNPITSSEFGLILKSKANQANLELDCSTFYYWNNSPCGGMLTLYGKTERLKIWNYALMSVDAINLIAQQALVENSSLGDCKVTVINKLEYSIFGVGNIHLYGSPAEIIENQSTSSGQLIQH